MAHPASCGAFSFQDQLDRSQHREVEMGYGIQTRAFRFGPRASPAGPPTWQGEWVAESEMPRGHRGEGGPRTGIGLPASHKCTKHCCGLTALGGPGSVRALSCIPDGTGRKP